MSRESRLDNAAIRAQFDELASLLTADLTVYLIGGGALTLQGLKNATKDIDLVVTERAQLRQLRTSLETTGYSAPDDIEDAYDRLDTAFILENEQRRFDVFYRQVAGVLVLSEPMEERSRSLFETDHLEVRMVSLNDIFLFKSVANREDDVDDMIVLAQAGLDDDLIVDEVHRQLDLVGRDHFIGAMNQKLGRLEDRGFSIGIHSTIERYNDRVTDAEAVKQCIDLLGETEYADDLYEGVPESRVRDRIGRETAESGIAWLERLGDLTKAGDGSLVLIERSD